MTTELTTPTDDNDADGWFFPMDKEKYHPYIASLMGFIHGQQYTNTKTFTREEMTAVTPVHVRNWMCMKAFRKTAITSTDRPKYCRGNTLAQMKKCSSHYFPNKGAQWIDGKGNPTRAQCVNEIIALVYKYEVRQEGSDSQCKRPLRQDEFYMTLELFKASSKKDFAHRRLYPMISLWQYHLIGRVDDCCNFKLRDPRGHPNFDFAIKTKVRWSKNVHEERKCPDQILLGSMDTRTCVIYHLAIYLEEFLSQYPQAVLLFTEQAPGPNVVKNLISRYRSRLQKDVWVHEDFKRLADEDDDEGIGTHSYRKFPSTYARSNGCTPDEIEIRGRWKHQGQRVVFRYIDVKQLFIDAKVAAALCIGGPIKYDLIGEAKAVVTNEWLFSNVVPCIRERFSGDSRLCRVLGLSLLFGCLDDELSRELPLHVVNRVRNAWEVLPLTAIPGGVTNNPVQRVPLHVYRINDTLCIDPVVSLQTPQQQQQQGTIPAGGGGESVVVGGVAPIPGSSGRGNQYDDIQAILIQQQHLRQQMTNMEQRIDGSLSSFQAWTRSQFNVVNNNIRRFGGTIQGAMARQDPVQAQERRAWENQQVQAALENHEADSASLSPAPKTLHELYTEWQYGIGGRKAARLWNSRERSRRADGIKQKFYRRSVVWKTLNRLVNKGYHVQEAIHMIKDAYGHNCTVSQYINKIIRDRQNGGHPNLR
jgi:Transcriptional activator of glycolytic enzymes